jgi:hypothetical protein
MERRVEDEECCANDVEEKDRGAKALENVPAAPNRAAARAKEHTFMISRVYSSCFDKMDRLAGSPIQIYRSSRQAGQEFRIQVCCWLLNERKMMAADENKETEGRARAKTDWLKF